MKRIRRIRKYRSTSYGSIDLNENTRILKCLKIRIKNYTPSSGEKKTLDLDEIKTELL